MTRTRSSAARPGIPGRGRRVLRLFLSTAFVMFALNLSPPLVHHGAKHVVLGCLFALLQTAVAGVYLATVAFDPAREAGPSHAAPANEKRPTPSSLRVIPRPMRTGAAEAA